MFVFALYIHIKFEYGLDRRLCYGIIVNLLRSVFKIEIHFLIVIILMFMGKENF